MNRLVSYLGILLVSLTPNAMLSTILSSAFYTIFNLFAGFLIPIPYYSCSKFQSGGYGCII
ncbi:abc transporter g family member 35 [Quercus suber]|uniref:Abc transporter g family member 35 n=1 Tax=Quercus suber TaxID=58331 RepID=A0AAW0KQ93_QUESU